MAFLRIAALNPQFMVETPAHEEVTAAEKASRELHLKLVRSGAHEGPGLGSDRKQEGQQNKEKSARQIDAHKVDPGKKDLMQPETLAGLKRLSKLIKRNSDGKTETRPLDRRRQKAFDVYKKIALGVHSGEVLGKKVDDFA